MREKSEMFELFKEFKQLVETKFGQKIATLRSDNGTEYKNQRMDDFCKKNGIKKEFTVPHRPQQNGVDERLNRTLDDMARSLLIDAKLPVGFWPEAIPTAAYIRNRCPVSTNDFKIPFEIWNNREADYDQLIKFGSIGYALKLLFGRKFGPKAQKLVFIGYADDAKAYKLYDPASRKFIVSRDVEFVEDKQELPDFKQEMVCNEEDYSNYV